MLVVYWRGLRAVCHHAAIMTGSSESLTTWNTVRTAGILMKGAERNFSKSPASGGSGGDDLIKSSEVPLKEPCDASPLVQPKGQAVQDEDGLPWLNIRAGILGLHDERALLPGYVGVTLAGPELKAERVTVSPLPAHITAEQLQGVLHGMDKASPSPHACDESEGEQCTISSTMLECKAQECPRLLLKELRPLFPSRPSSCAALTVVTLAQRTKNDMAAWSEAMQQEREVLLQQFVEAAQEICCTLQRSGYWADFLDPSSGRPYYGPYTNDTMFETDERYRRLGFTIEDFGCCKVISHGLFGSHVFVGAIFTDAPLGSGALEKTLVGCSLGGKEELVEH